MAWLFIGLAGLLEIVWATCMKQSRNWADPAALAMYAAMLGSFALLSLALRSLPLSTAYAIWTGIGAAGTVLVGMLLFGERIPPVGIAALLMIVGGIVLLKLSTGGAA